MTTCKRTKEGRVPSSVLPFLNVKTDGGHKDKHNREVMFVVNSLRKSGITRFNLMHINDAGLDGNIPMAFRGHYYDIGYQSLDGHFFLIEVMRIGPGPKDGKGKTKGNPCNSPGNDVGP